MYYKLNETFMQIINERSGPNGRRYAIEKFIAGAQLDGAIDSLLASTQALLSEPIENNMLLSFLVKGLFTFASKLDPSISSDTIKHLMDAITTVFGCCPELKKSVIDLILLN